jgi:hypothetical protein
MMMKVATASILLSLLAILVTPGLAAAVDNHHNPSVAVRLIVNRGRSIDPVCTSADQAVIVQASQKSIAGSITAATTTASSVSPSWCRSYCTDFERSSCWLAHPACGDNNSGSSMLEYEEGDEQQLGLLSEMELLVPDLNDSEQYGGFSPAMRASCLAQRTTALDAVHFLVPPPHGDQVSSECRMALLKHIIADCVLIPGEGAVVVVE